MATLRQERLAELEQDPTIKTRTEAATLAGYSPKTVDKGLSNILVTKGLQHARKRVLDAKRDSAATMRSIGDAALDVRRDEIDEMGTRDRLLVGAALHKAAAEIPADPIDRKAEHEGFAEWKARHRRVAFYLGVRSCRPQHVVLSPADNCEDAEIVNEDNKP